jgi:sarcosine oxidase, subunit beta
MSAPPPAACDVVVIGAGVWGLSVAWNLAKRRAGRVAVLERREAPVTGATPRAAALLSRVRDDGATAALVRETYAAVAELERASGDDLGLIRNGTLYIAGTPQTAETQAAQMTQAAARGDRVENLTPEQAAAKAPWLDPAAVVAAAFMPDDAFIDPYRLAHAYGAAARSLGVTMHTGCDVVGFTRTGGRVDGVELADGRTIKAGAVVVAGGVWSAKLLAAVGVGLGTAPVRSQYWITAPDRRFPRGHATVILPDAAAYARPELGALLFGLREACGFAADAANLPADLDDLDLNDADRGLAVLEAGWEALARFCPALHEVGLAHYVSGPSGYTLDGKFLLGPVAAAPGLILAAGCCGAGIAASGGVGRAVAASVMGEAADIDLSAFAPDRFAGLTPLDPAVGAACAARRSAKRHG